MRAITFLLATLFSIAVAACGGGGEITPPTTYSISGTVSGSVLSGVTITLSGAGSATTRTNSTGNYSFSGLANGSYTVTPTMTGYTFSPASSAASVNGADIANTGFAATTNTPTKLQVDAKILRAISDIFKTTTIEYYFSVSYDGVPSNLAIVSVNGTNVPRVVGFIPGYYDLREPATSYVPGQNYTISIQYSGTTYTETLKAPGGITVNAAGTNVQWIENSDYATISVEHVFGATTYSKKNVLESPAPLALLRHIFYGLG